MATSPLDGRVQGTLPTPIGVLSGEAEAEIVREGDMWGASLDADGTLYLPSGDVVGGGVDVAYVDTPDGSALSVDVEGSYTRPGVGTVGGSLGYDRIETTTVSTEQYEAGGYASGYGVQVEAGVEGTSVTTPTGRRPATGTSAATCRAGSPSSQRALASADNVEASVDDMFSDLG